jgi:hypothetical protein
LVHHDGAPFHHDGKPAVGGGFVEGWAEPKAGFIITEITRVCEAGVLFLTALAAVGLSSHDVGVEDALLFAEEE